MINAAYFSESNLPSSQVYPFTEENQNGPPKEHEPGTSAAAAAASDAASVAGSSSSGSLAPLPQYSTPVAKKARISDPFEEKVNKLLELAHQEQAMKLAASFNHRSEVEKNSVRKCVVLVRG